MREILGLGDEAPLNRRWFHDEYFDLFVWQDAGGALARFELCYGAGASERALVWLGGERLFHDGAPGAAPFVEVGTRVAQGQTIMIIEAMKTMNHIPAPKAGVVTAVLVGNAQPVEFGEPLAIIE